MPNKWEEMIRGQPGGSARSRSRVANATRRLGSVGVSPDPNDPVLESGNIIASMWQKIPAPLRGVLKGSGAVAEFVTRPVTRSFNAAFGVPVELYRYAKDPDTPTTRGPDIIGAGKAIGRALSRGITGKEHYTLGEPLADMTGFDPNRSMSDQLRERFGEPTFRPMGLTSEQLRAGQPPAGRMASTLIRGITARTAIGVPADIIAMGKLPVAVRGGRAATKMVPRVVEDVAATAAARAAFKPRRFRILNQPERALGEALPAREQLRTAAERARLARAAGVGPVDVRRLRQLSESAAAPTRTATTERIAGLRPAGLQDEAVAGTPGKRTLPTLEDNYTKPLSNYTDAVYRETDAERALELIPGAATSADLSMADLYFANDPSLALGQGRNRGILLEFDAGPIQGQVNTRKPAWQAAYADGVAEFVARNDQRTYRAALRKITVTPDAKMSHADKSQLKRALESLEQQGWRTVDGADGSRTYTKPIAQGEASLLTGPAQPTIGQHLESATAPTSAARPPAAPPPIIDTERLRKIANPIPPRVTREVLEPQFGRKGLEVFGKEVITADQVRSALRPVLAGAEKVPVVSKVVDWAQKAFNRYYVPPGAPAEVAEIPVVLDAQAAAQAARMGDIADDVSAAISAVRPSAEEARLMAYMREADWSPEGLQAVADLTADAPSHLRVSPDTLRQLPPERMDQLKGLANKIGQVQDAMAAEELRRGILQGTQDNYVTHLFEPNPDAIQQIQRVFPRLSENLQRDLSPVHRFTRREGPPTLIDALRANAAAKAAGLAEPFNVKSADMLELFSIRASAHQRSVMNWDALEELGRKPEIVRFGGDNPGGWTDVTRLKSGIKDIFPEGRVWIHPTAARKLEYELSAVLPEETWKGMMGEGVFRALDTGAKTARLGSTVLNFPFFQIMNELDNLSKLAVGGGLGKLGAAGQIVMRKGAVTLRNPIRIRDFAREGEKWVRRPGALTTLEGTVPAGDLQDLFGVAGLTETGQFGRRGDFAATFRQRLDEAGGVVRLPFGQQVRSKALRAAASFPRGVGEFAEDHAKIAMALEVAEQAGDLGVGIREAEKFLFRYNNLTPFEKQVLRPLSFFYTFPRKMLGLNAELMLSRPEVFAVMQKLGLKQNRYGQFVWTVETEDGNVIEINPRLSMGDIGLPTFNPVLRGAGGLAGVDISRGFRPLGYPGDVEQVSPLLRPVHAIDPWAMRVPETGEMVTSPKGKFLFEDVPFGTAGRTLGAVGTERLPTELLRRAGVNVQKAEELKQRMLRQQAAQQEARIRTYEQATGTEVPTVNELRGGNKWERLIRSMR